MPRNSPYTLEICVGSPAGIAASARVADRIELCGALRLGGLTPDIGMMEFAAAAGVETHALIRPRSGDFKMAPEDIAVAVSSIRAARLIGLKGVVIGAERDGALDRSALDAMVAATDGLDVTLHRVIDVVDDPVAALEVAIDLGAVRVLTSGAALTAEQGIAGLNRLYAAAAGRIEIMAGGGINSANLAQIMAATEITSFHASCSAHAPLDQRYVQFGFGETTQTLDVEELARLSGVCIR